MPSPEIPMTEAPKASKSLMASAKLCASYEQPQENAAGKKYRTTGPLARDSVKEYLLKEVYII